MNLWSEQKYWLGQKKKKTEKVWKKETAGCQQWNELRTQCADRGLTGCLAPSFSATVSSVWWICSQPVRGSYQKSVACQSGERTGGEMCSAGRQRPCESLWSTVNWSLWGQGPWLRQMYHEACFFSKNIYSFSHGSVLWTSKHFFVLSAAVGEKNQQQEDIHIQRFNLENLF